jgi:hypothetical protein
MVKLLEDNHERKAELTVELEKIKKAANVAESDSESDDNTGQDGIYGVRVQRFFIVLQITGISEAFRRHTNSI